MRASPISFDDPTLDATKAFAGYGRSSFGRADFGRTDFFPQTKVLENLFEGLVFLHLGLETTRR